MLFSTKSLLERGKGMKKIRIISLEWEKDKKKDYLVSWKILCLQKRGFVCPYFEDYEYCHVVQMALKIFHKKWLWNP
jgi:hypothetical protein